MTEPRDALARALEQVWPKHQEGSGGYPPSPHDETHEVLDAWGGMPDADAILAALASEGYAVRRDECHDDRKTARGNG